MLFLQRFLCFPLAVWCVWVGTACSAKYFTVWLDGRNKRQDFVRTILLSLYSRVRFILASSLRVMTPLLSWSKSSSDVVEIGGAVTNVLLSWICCRLYWLRMLYHGGSDRPCYISFAHHHRWGKTPNLLITVYSFVFFVFNQQLTATLSPTMPCRRLSAFGCVFSPSRLCPLALLSVAVGLWLLWRHTGWEWKTPLDGTSTIWLFWYGLMSHLENTKTAWWITLLHWCTFSTFYCEVKKTKKTFWNGHYSHIYKTLYAFFLKKKNTIETRNISFSMLFFQQSVCLVFFVFIRHADVPVQQKLCRRSSVCTSGPSALQPERQDTLPLRVKRHYWHDVTTNGFIHISMNNKHKTAFQEKKDKIIVRTTVWSWSHKNVYLF